MDMVCRNRGLIGIVGFVIYKFGGVWDLDSFFFELYIF